MSRVEIDNSLAAALGTPVAIGSTLAAEDTVLGYSTHEGLVVSNLFADQYDSAATALAKTASADPNAMLKCQSGQAESACVQGFIATFGAKAWRRPLESDEVTALDALYANARSAGDSQNDAFGLLVQAIIESTGFLYRTELGQGGDRVALTQYEIAAELSYLVTAGPPDAELLAAAEVGLLSDPEERVEELQRLLASPGARPQMLAFVEQWLGLQGVDSFQKDNNAFPAFNTAMRDSIAAETERFIETVLFDEGSKVQTLLAADFTIADDRVAAYIGLTEKPGATPKRVSIASLPRRGILSQAGFLSVNAHNADGSPVKRGLAVRKKLLCDEIPNPPPSVVIAVPPVTATQTTRERAGIHANPGCQNCHALIDPIGFGLESFDGMGKHRTMESGKTIDDSGELTDATPSDPLDVAGPFKGAVELATKLSTSKRVGQCTTANVVRYAIGRRETADDQGTMTLAQKTFDAKGQTLFGALEGVVRSPAFTARKGLQ